jgi:hypothetical protein
MKHVHTPVSSKSDTDGKEADRMNEREMMICGEDDYRDVQGEKSSL